LLSKSHLKPNMLRWPFLVVCNPSDSDRLHADPA
jgi:hypothetical protein